MIPPSLLLLWLIRAPAVGPAPDVPASTVTLGSDVVGSESLSLLRQSRDAWFAEDKVRHLAMSFFTVAVTQASGRAAGLDAGAATSLGAAGGIIAGLGKEVYDQRDHGLFSVRDLVWDAAGIALAVLFVREVR